MILTDDTEDQDKLVEETPCALQLLETLWLVETFKTIHGTLRNNRTINLLICRR